MKRTTNLESFGEAIPKQRKKKKVQDPPSEAMSYNIVSNSQTNFKNGQSVGGNADSFYDSSKKKGRHMNIAA